MTESTNESPATPVVFIHGLWMHASSWTPWVELFTEKGYDAVAPGWPGDAATVEDTRANAEAMNNVGIQEVTDHYAALLKELPSEPILIGHSFGGLIAQKLQGMGLARGCVALSPAQFKGILGLPLVQLESALPVLGKPWLRTKTWAHSSDSYAKNFANGVPRAESDRLFQQYTIPAPGRPLFQAGLANFSPRSPARVDTKARRGPLLLLGGSVDRTVPAATVRAAYKIQMKNPAVTEMEILDGRGHSFPADSGWREAADKALTFLSANGL